MECIRRLERLGYQFDIRPIFKYTKPGHTPPPEAAPLLADMKAHKEEAVLFVAEGKLCPKYTKLSEQYRTAITKGILSGRNPYDMLIQAIQCISDMTGDSVFYTQNVGNIKAVYGVGLSEPTPLQIELAEVRQRLAMLQRPELENESPDNHRRIDHAIKMHQERENQILEMLAGRE